jgi:DNA-3-methyladenine glycosylase I
VHDDRTLAEFLFLNGFQCGLSWKTVLKKRPRFRQVFDNFDAGKIANYDAAKVAELKADRGIIRNQRKIEGAIVNAQAFLRVQEDFGTFDAYVWRFVEQGTKRNPQGSWKKTPTRSPESEALSADLSRRGFVFVGPTLCYAYMQAVGLVNDHIVGCERGLELQQMA